MHKPITHCLLCERELQRSPSWQQLLTTTFSSTICSRCEQRFEKIEASVEQDVTSLFRYNEAMKDYIHRYKFLGDVVLAHVFRAEFAQHLKGETRIIVPIPMHPTNLKLRTFAPVDELLKAANISFQHCLIKTSTAQQSKKTREERFATETLFEVMSTKEIKNKELLLIDDIYTTGATITRAREVLLQAGVRSVKGLTLIRS